MPDLDELFEAAAEALGLGLDSAVRSDGGDINRAFRLRFTDGSQAFLKTRSDAPPEEFEVEAAGLEWLTSAGGPRVPGVLAVVQEPQPALLLEWIEPGGRLDEAGERQLATGLARIHDTRLERFGELPPGSPDVGLHVGPIKLAPVPGSAETGFSEFYAERIEDLAAQAQDQGAIDAGDAGLIGTLCEHMDELAGQEEPPSLTHGDLWSGNVLVAADGSPCLIDPAAHGANRELDLAMLSLFSTPAESFFSTYDELLPLADGWRQRLLLWQLQPLLIHAVLFGGSYGRSAVSAARNYL